MQGKDQQKKAKGVAAGEKQHFLRGINEAIPPNTKVSDSKIDHTYVPHHVYGFAGAGNKSCLYFGKNNNEIVFMAAAMGVVQDLTTREQKFFGGAEKTKMQKKYENNWVAHQDDITDLSVAAGGDRNIVATAECGAKSTVHVWDTNTMKSIGQFSLGGAAKGISALSFSPCQRYIACVDQSNDHMMTIYNINRRKQIVQVSAGTDPIEDIQWSKKPNDLRFSAVTTRSLQFWHPADATKKLFKNGTFGQKYSQTKFLCASFDEEGLCYSGGANGAVHCWDQRGELGIVLKAHAGSCTAVVCHQGMLVSTGADYKVTIHSSDKGTFEYIRQIPLQTLYQACSIDYLDGKILVGHDNGRIATVGVEGTDQTIVNVSHHDGECWGLEVIPEQATFLTCGDDNEFHEFSIRDKSCIRSGKVWLPEYNNGKSYSTNKIKSTASTLCSYPAHQQARAICYSRLHNHVAVSNNHGDVTIFDYKDFSKVITQLLDPKEWAEVMKYSPDNKFLAVGAHDDSIYVYAVSFEGQYSMHYAISFVHSSAIVGMDWSKDSKYLRAVDQAYAKQFYDVVECEQFKEGQQVLTSPNIWETSTCKLGWEVAGIFPLGADGTDVNAVDCNEARTMIAVADDFGTLCVYKFPCIKNSMDCRRIGGHSEHVTRVKFYENDNDQANECIITAGGMDRTYIQWKAQAVKEED